MTVAIVSPILGSKPKSNVHLGLSMTPSSELNSCTRILPTVISLRAVAFERLALIDLAGPRNSAALRRLVRVGLVVAARLAPETGARRQAGRDVHRHDRQHEA